MSTRNSKKPVKNNGHDLKDLLAVRECLNLLEQHKLAEAKKVCQEILKRAPTLVFANHAMGLIAMEEEDFNTAETELRKAVAADPGNAGYLTSLGKAVLKCNRIDDAIKLFEQAIAIDTDSKEARIGLANALHEKNDPDASIAYFEDAVRRAPNAPGPLSHLGSALIDAKRYQEADSPVWKRTAQGRRCSCSLYVPAPESASRRQPGPPAADSAASGPDGAGPFAGGR